MFVAAAVAIALILLLVLGQAVVLQRQGGLSPNRAQVVPVSAAAVAAATPPGPVGAVVAFLRRRPWARRMLSGGSIGVLVIAVGMLGFPFYSNLLQERIQQRLSRELASPELRQAYIDGRIAEGESLTRIKIPAIDVDVVVVQGTGADALRAGAGHYVSTPLPCEDGNVGIAGHRTTYGKPFANIDLLKPGDEITLETPRDTCTYRIDAAPAGRNALIEGGAPFIVTPTDISVIAQSAKPMVTLTSCHPKGSAAQRIVIQATLVSRSPTSGGA